MKTLDRSLAASSPVAASRVLREKSSLQSLSSHPSIVRLLSTSKDAASLHFVLEPALGGPLFKHIRSSSSSSRAGSVVTCVSSRVSLAAYYGLSLVLALQYMHSLGIAHRDLKCSNVLLSSTGRCVIVDFGYSIALPKPPAKTYTYCGTLHAMSPELVARAGHDKTVDCWSFAVLLHEICTGGFPPFGFGVPSPREPGESRNTTERRIAEGSGAGRMRGEARDEDDGGGPGKGRKLRFCAVQSSESESESESSSPQSSCAFKTNLDFSSFASTSNGEHASDVIAAMLIADLSERLTDWEDVRRCELFAGLTVRQHGGGVETVQDEAPVFDRTLGQLEVYDESASSEGPSGTLETIRNSLLKGF